jgi:hypothetical protein
VNRPATTPERVYRQLRQEPVIQTADEALEYLAKASSDDLRTSAKLSVDRHIKDVLRCEGFDALDEEVREELHTNMLEIRSSFRTGDLESLSERAEQLRKLSESDRIAPAAGDQEHGQQLRDRVLRLAEEVGTAVSLHGCIRAGEEREWEPADLLTCLLRGGP